MANETECYHYGIDPKVVEKFEIRIDKLLKDMDGHGLSIFCGSAGSIRANDTLDDGCQLIVGSIGGINHDGGCGAMCEHDEDGLIRGEGH